MIREKAAPALVRWMVKQERLAGAETALKLVKNGYRYVDGDDEDQFKAHYASLCDEEMAHEKIAREAADIGSQVHALVEKHLKDKLGIPFEINRPVTDLAQSLFSTKWLPWEKDVDLQPIAIEKRVFHEGLFFAGTIDLAARVEGELSICDWKGSTDKFVDTLWIEQVLQNVSYREAMYAITGERWTGHVVKLSRDGEGFKCHKIEPKPEEHWTVEGMLEAFVACLVLYRTGKVFAAAA